ncbi:MAG: M23 family metallopeptidase [Gemmatimonadetes bacterium]|nr:M23 family metallopeptidase [Gemmatimonadota bacterium]
MRRLPVLTTRFSRRMLALLLVSGAWGCALPRWPVAGVLTSPFGLRLRGWRPDLHEGVDIAAPEGTPVRALRGGTVTFAGVQGGYGNVVYIQHGGGVISVYGHLSRIAVTRGARVANGEVIGAVGRTGDASGAHLHLEVWRGRRAEDPVPLLGGFPPRGPAR